VWPVVDLYFTAKRYASPLTGQVLPCPGSPGEQPAALMDAFVLLDTPEKSDAEPG
jgi:hypothetical protein